MANNDRFFDGINWNTTVTQTTSGTTSTRVMTPFVVELSASKVIVLGTSGNNSDVATVGFRYYVGDRTTNSITFGSRQDTAVANVYFYFVIKGVARLSDTKFVVAVERRATSSTSSFTQDLYVAQLNENNTITFGTPATGWLGTATTEGARQVYSVSETSTDTVVITARTSTTSSDYKLYTIKETGTLGVQVGGTPYVTNSTSVSQFILYDPISGRNILQVGTSYKAFSLSGHTITVGDEIGNIGVNLTNNSWLTYFDLVSEKTFLNGGTRVIDWSTTVPTFQSLTVPNSGRILYRNTTTGHLVCADTTTHSTMRTVLTEYDGTNYTAVTPFTDIEIDFFDSTKQLIKTETLALTTTTPATNNYTFRFQLGGVNDEVHLYNCVENSATGFQYQRGYGVKEIFTYEDTFTGGANRNRVANNLKRFKYQK